MYKKGIELLNKAVSDELGAVHQYRYFHFHCYDQGIELLSALFKRTAIECAANADSATKKLCEDLVMDEEGYFGQFDDDAENVKQRTKMASGPKPGGV